MPDWLCGVVEGDVLLAPEHLLGSDHQAFCNQTALDEDDGE